MVYGKISVDKLDAIILVRKGIMRIPRLTGRIFDGDLKASLELANGADNRIVIRGELDTVNIGQVLSSVTGSAAANGQLKVNLDLSSEGKSIRNLVNGLDGKALIALSDLEASGKGEGSVISGLVELLNFLDKINAPEPRKRASMIGNFMIAQGVARSDNIKLVSSHGNGFATGHIDLPAWTIDMEGRLELDKRLLDQLVRSTAREVSPKVPFTISGVLDSPAVKVNTSVLFGTRNSISVGD